jgi:virulence-associated protein VagC
MAKKQDLVKVDSRNRITIPKKIKFELDRIYKIYQKDDKIILEPIKEIPEREKWLFDPKNKPIVERLRKALAKKPTIDFDELKKTLKL